jgi:GntR family transcriptional regulator/MocR family aminotransferase
MLGFIIQFDPKKSKYIQLYQYIKQEIHQGTLVEGTKLPSIRSLSETLGISKSTVENAYGQLIAEGYIESRPKKGYYVSALDSYFFGVPERENKTIVKDAIKPDEKANVEALFDTDGIERNLFDFNIWKKMLTKVIEYDTEALISYGDVQGEYALRKEIARFIHESRGVKCTPHQIIVGAGVQSLFVILAALLRSSQDTIAFESPGFYKGATLFEDFGFKTIEVPVKAQGINLDILMSSGAKLAYISPSHQYPTGSTMPINNRLKLLKWASEENAYIIEDDYDSILRYEGMPIPSLQGLNKGENVIYVGAFSKLLLPSLRISFVVIPLSLMEAYDKMKMRYSQTVSKIEQLALAHFMNEGYFDRHIRRIKKWYGKKNQRLIEALKSRENAKFSIIGKSSGLHIMFSFERQIDVLGLSHKMKRYGIKFDHAGIFEGKKIAVLSYSGLEDSAIEKVVEMIVSGIDAYDHGDSTTGKETKK